MTPVAVVILAHNDPQHVRRLIGALPDLPIFLHCDAKTPREVAAAMHTGLPSRVFSVASAPTSLASWSLVEAELRGLRKALARTAARHIVIASGADYPLVGVQELADGLERWGDRSYIRNARIPYRPWDTLRNPDGGLWRFQHRFLLRRNQIVYVRGVPLRSPFHRGIPDDLRLRASSQWKIYSRRDAELLLTAVERRPDLIRFWRTTLVPEESFVASMLASPAVTGEEPLARCRTDAWYINWARNDSPHPEWLVEADFPLLEQRSRAGAAAPTWFARKFSTTESGPLLDRIDAECRSAHTGG
jgi:phage gpG-like protein